MPTHNERNRQLAEEIERKRAREGRIRQRAREIYYWRGAVEAPGDELSDWLLAEQQIDEEDRERTGESRA